MKAMYVEHSHVNNGFRGNRLNETQGLQQHPPTGQACHTFYVDIYDWEMYFDGSALAYYGGEELSI
jgi:hypothetical protein